ncbi:hypothetical protein GCM10022421_22000 [Oceanisphaera sediminis]|uniref:Replication protein n=1 Tax=Oceanisphaera sediminis TaxID=981381 RepID=A0ABP7E5Z4_9GAMM
MNSDYEQEVTCPEKHLSLIDKLRARRERYEWELKNSFEHHIFDIYRDGKSRKKVSNDGEMVWDRKNKSLKRLMKYAGLDDLDLGLIGFIFADYLLNNQHLLKVDGSVGETYYSNTVARDFSLYLRKEYGIKVGTIGLSLPDLKYMSKKQRGLIHSAYQALALLQRAIRQNGRLVSFTLLLPTELVQKQLDSGGLENARKKIARKITDSLKDLKDDMMVNLELELPEVGEGIHNPHLHGLVIIPGPCDNELEFKYAKDRIRKIMISAVGKTNNARHQLQFDSFYSQGWMTYIRKNIEAVSELIGGSANISSNPVRAAGTAFYNIVKAEMESKERVLEVSTKALSSSEL